MMMKASEHGCATYFLDHFDSLGISTKTELHVVQHHHPVWLDGWYTSSSALSMSAGSAASERSATTQRSPTLQCSANDRHRQWLRPHPRPLPPDPRRRRRRQARQLPWGARFHKHNLSLAPPRPCAFACALVCVFGTDLHACATICQRSSQVVLRREYSDLVSPCIL